MAQMVQYLPAMPEKYEFNPWFTKIPGESNGYSLQGSSCVSQVVLVVKCHNK